MSKRQYMFWLKALILLSPLPFGCVGKIWSPVFFLLILVFSALTLNQVRGQVPFLYERWFKILLSSFFAFALFQMVPLPRFLLKILSPHTVVVLDRLKDVPVSFHPISVLPFETLGFVLRLFVLLFLFFLLLNLEMNKWEIFSIFNTMILAACIQVFIGLIKLLQGNDYFFIFFRSQTTINKSVLAGTIADPGHFSFYLELIFPLALGMFLVQSNLLGSGFHALRVRQGPMLVKRTLLFMLISLVLIGIGILLSGSANGLVALAVILFLMAAGGIYLKINFSLKRKLKSVLLLAALLAVAVGLQNGRATFIDPNTGQNLNLSPGGNINRLFSDFPVFGAGLATFRYIYFLYDNGYTDWLTHAHNEYLEYLSEGGLVGTALFFSLLGLLLFSLFRMWWLRHNLEIKGIVLAVLASGMAAVLHSFFDFALRIPANAFILTVIAALGIQMVNYKKRAVSYGK